ncbi:MAG: hypothetical protein M3R00_05015 [Pseudomonadota bacterium]|nr:hypothetical protein [Pseudomonadota bacterium]
MNTTPEISTTTRMGFFDDSIKNQHMLYDSALQLLDNRNKKTSNASPLIIKLGEKVITLANLAGKGGSKKVYDIGDGSVIMLPNTGSDGIDTTKWVNLVQREVAMAKRLNDCGLRAQQYEAAIITVNEFPLLVIKAPSFDGMIKNGLQPRDRKRDWQEEISVLNRHCPGGWETRKVNPDLFIGSSDVFGTKENLTSPNYWRTILDNLVDDLAPFLANDLSFTSDSFNLLIEDTATTPEYSHELRGSISERNQRIRLFFYDFYLKEGYSEDHYEFIDAKGAIIESKIKFHVTNLLSRISDTIILGASNAEYKSIMQTDEPSAGMTTELSEMAREAKATAMPEFAAKVIATTKQMIEAMPLEQRFLRFSVDRSSTDQNSIHSTSS